MLIEVIGQFEAGGKGMHFAPSSEKFETSAGVYTGIAVILRPDVPVNNEADHEEFCVTLTIAQALRLQEIIADEIRKA